MIKQFLSILVGLSLFVAPACGMGKGLGINPPCFLCKNEISDIRNQAFSLSCDHGYHPKCIYSWSRTNPYCPRCTRPINTEDMQDLNSRVELPPLPSKQASHTPDRTNRNNRRNDRTLFFLCGCAGIAVMVLYYFKDNIGELCWSKKDTEPLETEPQKIV